jgi:hypothetical protein
MLIPFSHRILHFFAILHILRISRALFATFWCINREISTKKVEKVQKCKKSAMRCEKVQCDAMSFNKKCKCECDAIKVRCALTKSANANEMRKSFCTTIPAIYLVPMNLTNFC